MRRCAASIIAGRRPADLRRSYRGRRYPHAGCLPRGMARLDHAGVESRADRRGLQRRTGQVGAVLDRQHGHGRHGAEHRPGRQVLARQRRRPDNADDKASFWTTTKASATTAQMFEVFGLEQRDRSLEFQCASVERGRRYGFDAGERALCPRPRLNNRSPGGAVPPGLLPRIR